MIYLIPVLCYLALALFEIIAFWKVFAKANQPGWAIFIPIYNYYIMLKMAGRPGWWLLLMLIPVVNLVIAIIVAIDVAKSFGHSAGFGLGLAFLGLIFYPILGYGSSTYREPVAAA
ncbi:MAG TPA: DUF5684 domain-containing protein [Candidatus Didemnitutus sp.]|jgi:hypothetical protein